MKKLLDSKRKEVVNIYDEVNLWSAPFGKLLLENIPMEQGATIVDIGFGTGFPLIELSQRFGEKSKLYGIDVWKEAINLVKQKIKVLEINNIELIEESAVKIRIDDNQIDLVTSNLGINNFEDKEKVYLEIKRVLKKKGKLCITTNPVGTFKEIFELFMNIFNEMKLEKEATKLEEYVKHRSTFENLISEFGECGFKLVKSKADTTVMRFVNAEAVLNHSLIRIGFRRYWEDMIQKETKADFFYNLVIKLKNIINTRGEFKMTIPMLYLEFQKE